MGNKQKAESLEYILQRVRDALSSDFINGTEILDCVEHAYYLGALDSLLNNNKKKKKL